MVNQYKQLPLKESVRIEVLCKLCFQREQWQENSNQDIRYILRKIACAIDDSWRLLAGACGQDAQIRYQFLVVAHRSFENLGKLCGQLYPVFLRDIKSI